MITSQILARSLGVSGQTHEFINYVMQQRARGNNLTVCYRKNKLTSLFHASVS